MDVKGLKGKGGKKYGQWSIGVFEELRNSANTNKDNASAWRWSRQRGAALRKQSLPRRCGPCNS